MKKTLKKMERAFFKNSNKIGSSKTPASSFHSDHYLRHNARRLEHLASLGIHVAGQTVLELGSGIGDHSHYYIDRRCTITITEARAENLEFLKNRYPDQNVQFLNMEDPPAGISGAPFDIVHCYGLLYHLSNPGKALKYINSYNNNLLLLETCVSFGKEEKINQLAEEVNDITQSFSGTGCRPTRLWLYNRLRELYEHVYIPKTQPNHHEFPLDWTSPEKHSSKFSRAVFIASRKDIKNDLLAPCLLDYQHRHP